MNNLSIRAHCHYGAKEMLIVLQIQPSSGVSIQSFEDFERRIQTRVCCRAERGYDKACVELNVTAVSEALCEN
jgi:hypothetical protein